MDREDIQSKAADLVKRLLTVGVGAIFLTEEGLRTLFAEMKLPKELLTGVLQSAGKSKDEFLAKLSSDILEKVVAKMDPSALVEEFLKKHEVDLHVKIKFNPKSKSN